MQFRTALKPEGTSKDVQGRLEPAKPTLPHRGAALGSSCVGNPLLGMGFPESGFPFAIQYSSVKFVQRCDLLTAYTASARP